MTGPKRTEMNTNSLPTSNKNLAAIFASALLVADSVLVFLMIAYVPYTKIDWDAYMSQKMVNMNKQVNGFLDGERDYSNLKGDTGPLVYPAGFLYVYSAIQHITGGEVHPAQLPWWALSLLALSKRVHSIFLLRLFNDCIVITTLLHAALATLLYQRWFLGLIIFRKQPRKLATWVPKAQKDEIKLILPVDSADLSTIP